MEQYSTGIIPFSYFLDEHKVAGSTILRANALANNSKDFLIWEHGHRYDQLIFQKAYWPEMMDLFNGPKILDLCDPDWILGEVDIVEIGNLVDAITCSSDSLTGLMKTYFPHKIICHVPDRLDFSKFPNPKKHHFGIAKNAVWFGFIKNAHLTLPALSEVIINCDLKLTIIADQPYHQDDAIMALSPNFIKYEEESVYQFIKEADIVLNPKSEQAFFKYKSNNKSIISRKLGVPVAENETEVVRLINGDERNQEICRELGIINECYNITKSVEEYRAIFSEIRNKKNEWTNKLTS